VLVDRSNIKTKELTVNYTTSNPHNTKREGQQTFVRMKEGTLIRNANPQKCVKKFFRNS
jgi:hypothetical protein